MEVKISLTHHTMVIKDDRISLYSIYDGGFVRHLDEYEEAMVRAAYEFAKGESK